MPIDDENSMTNREHSEKLWQQLLSSPHSTEQSNAAIEAHKTTLITAFSRSSFLADTLTKCPDALTTIMQAPPTKAHFSFYKGLLAEALDEVSNEDQLMSCLRNIRNQQMACITFHDVLNKQSIEDSLHQVSALADALICSAYQWLYDNLINRYGKPTCDSGEMHMYILGMGKLGGKELNFSSDIDLIFAYPEKGETQGGRKSIEHQQFFTKLAQKLIQALNKVTNDGQVYRVDMRLRPFGDSGPLVMHFAALEDYYQDQGRHWERFAMVKARIVNDDNSDNAKWLKSILHPFTFRRYLDFTTLDALRNMKKLIATEIRRRRLSNNIKLGAGGIREVEFFAQSFQLIHGGREPSLQSKSLLTTLCALHEIGIIEQSVTQQLTNDYLFLRKVEHTLQQCEDKQTQTLPDSLWQQNALTDVMNFERYEDFLKSLEATMARIHGHFNELVEESQETHDEEDTLFSACQDAWRLSLQEEEFRDAFCNHLSNIEISGIFGALSDFKEKQRHYRMGQKGEDTLNKLLPEILYVLVNQHPTNAIYVLHRILGVIEAITGRTTYLDLLLENPDVLRQLVRLCERSEWIAQEIKRFPLLLDELLTPLYLGQQNTDIVTSKREYELELRETMLRIEQDDVEMLMDAWRQFKLCQQLRIAASDISDSLPINNVSDKLTVLAEVILDNVVNAAWIQMQARFGIPSHLEGADKGFAVVGYGKLGGYELGYGSDLDLVFLHNAPRGSTTNGTKSIESQQFYIKLAQRIMHLLNTKTLFGQLYETDLRLRPSGNAGLLCCHIDGFEKYQKEEAWTWEHQALVRARAICGDASLLEAFKHVRKAILCQKRDVATLAEDVCKMRIKMREHLLNNSDDKVDLKQCEGGITDIEFMAQYWVLAHAHQLDALTVYPDNLRIFDAAASGNLIKQETANELQNAYLALREQYHHLTLADTKFADQTEELEVIRERVTTQYNALFGKCGTS
ncbi:bifunctional [glutamate--ammonia ligase]-adenylyl-L-tyrosine phosphorylase/[glutamate--ammonia-ligase] adenylyltransferase [Alteromonas sp. 009811495]|uniref:bifunctional [glutamate--ammonia ligase]-adenylyl-L-tyrosine phosphorylase/[glutamate--ammonia-ligase] adenylyltransferase n=1 Tax=Alteromonas sp. 009811495 TaxID=3002962 RepID=UPI00237D5066|nr:bifunctional [glutamate--ammonia ligase]-adenylyl-L-tyrosine phosphorylase/[glutamate--ammonia-ligase] adenylyltransferase [Alteromonas sp. 009811495]WDT85043.1 bifunctional [glutamate--ammonia ligase]-adenylyl-L-tyrosine phosphorylase/[glutamate--ammonia-ligase] adenylyltransferase [Alteromonas sp. 009811495]